MLDVALGSGHNSIYIASLLPQTYDLVEPNPLGGEDLLKIFDNLSIEHAKSTLFPQYLEDVKNEKLYDVVICKGLFGGFLEYEKRLLV